jgi:hypothetical protein
MSEAAGRGIPEEVFLDRVAWLCSAGEGLSPVGAGLLVALHLGICNDSRTFARLFGIAHALVLREVTELDEGHGFLHVVDRNARTQRTVITLTDTAAALLQRFP